MQIRIRPIDFVDALVLVCVRTAKPLRTAKPYRYWVAICIIAESSRYQKFTGFNYYNWLTSISQLCRSCKGLLDCWLCMLFRYLLCEILPHGEDFLEFGWNSFPNWSALVIKMIMLAKSSKWYKSEQCTFLGWMKIKINEFSIKRHDPIYNLTATFPFFLNRSIGKRRK